LLIVTIGLNEARYYYYYQDDDMRKQALADFAITNDEAYKIVHKKIQMLLSLMNDSEVWARDRIAASKELTKYVDYMIIPDKKNYVFANNALVDNSSNKQITTNNMVNFSKLPGMDDPDVRKELSTNIIDGEFEEQVDD
jgi:hypothetical protein